MKKSISPTVLSVVLSLAFTGLTHANPSIRTRSGPDAVEQSPSSNDLSMSDRVSHVLSSNTALAGTHGDISVVTTTDHLIMLRGSVSKDADHEKIMSALGSSVGGYKVEDDLVTILR